MLLSIGSCFVIASRYRFAEPAPLVAVNVIGSEFPIMTDLALNFPFIGEPSTTDCGREVESRLIAGRFVPSFMVTWKLFLCGCTKYGSALVVAARLRVAVTGYLDLSATVP